MYVAKSFADPQMCKAAEWTAAMLNGAVAPAAELGISPEAIVAQAALESSWGRAAIGHNVFGIKTGGDWSGPRLMRRTAEQDAAGNVYYVDAWFRDYASYGDCIDGWLAFLRKYRNYADAGVFTARNDAGFFAALKRAGYATDVNYVEKLLGMVSSVRIFVFEVDKKLVPMPSEPAGSRLLLIGSHGGDVETLQRALKLHGDYAGPIDGDFGPATKAAVEHFQSVKGLAADGIVGEATRKGIGL